MPYTHIQFIAHCIGTTPALVPVSGEPFPKKRYLGLPDVTADIRARVTLVKDAIALAQDQADPSDAVLKLFMLPEFFFRGSNGAYQMEEAFEVVARLQHLVKAPAWRDWIFVFGTIVATYAMEKAPSSVPAPTPVTDRPEAFLRQIYNFALLQRGGFGVGSGGVGSRGAGDGIDGTGAAPGNAVSPAGAAEQARIVQKRLVAGGDFIVERDSAGGFVAQRIFESSMVGGDPRVVPIVREAVTANQQKLIGYLKALVELNDDGLRAIRAGTEEIRAWNRQKPQIRQWLSSRDEHADLVGRVRSWNASDLEDEYTAYDLVEKYLEFRGEPQTRELLRARPLAEEEQLFPFSGTAIFDLVFGQSGGDEQYLTFGLEVCLDHETRRLSRAASRDRIDVQLIPSCGMAIRSSAIAVNKPQNYIFNCDGSGIQDSEVGPNQGGLLLKSHSNVVKSDPSHFELYRPVALPEGNRFPVADRQGLIRELFPHGAGVLHVYPQQPVQLRSRPASAVAQSLSAAALSRSRFTTRAALAETPVLLNGMKVLFDQSVPVTPVRLVAQGAEQPPIEAMPLSDLPQPRSRPPTVASRYGRRPDPLARYRQTKTIEGYGAIEQEF